MKSFRRPFKRPLIKLGQCVLCGKPVSKMVRHTIFGDDPMWRSTNTGVYHKSCWILHKKSIPRKTEVTGTIIVPPFKLEVKSGEEELKPEEMGRNKEQKEGKEKGVDKWNQ